MVTAQRREVRPANDPEIARIRERIAAAEVKPLLCSTRAACAMLGGVSPDRLHELREQKRITATRRKNSRGSHWKWSVNSIEQYVASL